jgi:hypothetical protein
MRRTRLDLGDVERAFRIDVADRYPFLGQDELDRGLTNMRSAGRPTRATVSTIGNRRS